MAFMSLSSVGAEGTISVRVTYLSPLGDILSLAAQIPKGIFRYCTIPGQHPLSEKRIFCSRRWRKLTRDKQEEPVWSYLGYEHALGTFGLSWTIKIENVGRNNDALPLQYILAIQILGDYAEFFKRSM
jgi:hypothetical protein